MNTLFSLLTQAPCIYVTRDAERALGINPLTEGYHIITNFSQAAKGLTNNKKHFVINEEKPLSTRELLLHPLVKEFIESIPNAHIVVFKNTSQIEKICEKQDWPLLNPNANTAKFFENKISQIKALEPVKEFLIPYVVRICGSLIWDKKPFFLQFNTSHTGGGTFLIDKPEKLEILQKQFPNRECRTGPVIEGMTYTSNNIVTSKNTIVGNISYQITGFSPFTDISFATIGNDWHMANTAISQKQRKSYYQVVQKVGEIMKSHGWKGLFGIDMIYNLEKQQWFIIEINARQPASTTFESLLQSEQSKHGITTFGAHIMSLYEMNPTQDLLTKLISGAQIVFRKQESIKCDKTCLKSIMEQIDKKLSVIQTPYTPEKNGQELLRIQTVGGFMKQHNQLNEQGKVISEMITQNI